MTIDNVTTLPTAAAETEREAQMTAEEKRWVEEGAANVQHVVDMLPKIGPYTVVDVELIEIGSDGLATKIHRSPCVGN
ncbi:hypothetical protein ACO2I3_01055 [Leptospira interrogans]